MQYIHINIFDYTYMRIGDYIATCYFINHSHRLYSTHSLHYSEYEGRCVSCLNHHVYARFYVRASRVYACSYKHSWLVYCCIDVTRVSNLMSYKDSWDENALPRRACWSLHFRSGRNASCSVQHALCIRSRDTVKRCRQR
jgi:hypothetical protein